AAVTRPTSALVGRPRALAALELDHELTQQPVQLRLLVVAQRAGEERLLPRLDADRAAVGLAAVVGQLDDDLAPVARVGQAPHKARLLHPVEPVRHRPARELHALRERAGRAAIRLAGLRQRGEQLVLAELETELAERLVESAVDAPGDPGDPVDEPLDLQVEIGEHEVDRLEEPIDVVALRAPGRVRHLFAEVCQKILLTSRDSTTRLSMSKYFRSRKKDSGVLPTDTHGRRILATDRLELLRND